MNHHIVTGQNLECVRFVVGDLLTQDSSKITRGDNIEFSFNISAHIGSALVTFRYGNVNV